eukprot:443550_1
MIKYFQELIFLQFQQQTANSKYNISNIINKYSPKYFVQISIKLHHLLNQQQIYQPIYIHSIQLIHIAGPVPTLPSTFLANITSLCPSLTASLSPTTNIITETACVENVMLLSAYFLVISETEHKLMHMVLF